MPGMCVGRAVCRARPAFDVLHLDLYSRARMYSDRPRGSTAICSRSVGERHSGLERAEEFVERRLFLPARSPQNRYCDYVCYSTIFLGDALAVPQCGVRTLCVLHSVHYRQLDGLCARTLACCRLSPRWSRRIRLDSDVLNMTGSSPPILCTAACGNASAAAVVFVFCCENVCRSAVRVCAYVYS